MVSLCTGNGACLIMRKRKRHSNPGLRFFSSFRITSPEMAAAFDGGHAEETSLAKLVPSETHGGRAVVAACNLTAGTVVLRSLPAAYAVHDHLRSRRCAVCLRKASSQLELQRCTQCRCLHYCSKRCQLVDWQSGHKLECRHLQGMGDGQAAEDSKS